jgi:hypothetical protein
MIDYIQVTDTLGFAKLTIIGENPYIEKGSQLKRDLISINRFSKTLKPCTN